MIRLSCWGANLQMGGDGVDQALYSDEPLSPVASNREAQAPIALRPTIRWAVIFPRSPGPTVNTEAPSLLLPSSALSPPACTSGNS